MTHCTIMSFSGVMGPLTVPSSGNLKSMDAPKYSVNGDLTDLWWINYALCQSTQGTFNDR